MLGEQAHARGNFSTRAAGEVKVKAIGRTSASDWKITAITHMKITILVGENSHLTEP